ncbi:DUF5693 family protein [Gorillibacterium sp. sgz5001074]|uniref:DUF5693 family protein n=1 Tax=Gorillibacterium sp. sgz5001074 TaxID=3446695 RepID=UPI003F669915
MGSRYRRVNDTWRKLLWWVVIGSLLLALPIAGDRYKTESTSKRVEFVFDYRDLLEIADTKPNPRGFAEEQLKKMKQAGIGSLAVYESTLNELKLARRIELYNSHDATALTQTPASAEGNQTYILFTEAGSQAAIQEMIERTFNRLGVKMRAWNYKGQPGLILDLPLEDASMKPLPADPVALKTLRDKGFEIVIRLGNRKAFTEQEMNETLKQLSDYKVQSVIIDGESIPGYSTSMAAMKKNIPVMADLLKKYGMAVAIIEPVSLKTPQKGMTLLAKELDYNVVRLHSIAERDSDKLSEMVPEEQLEGRIRDLSDRMVLAVKDRNIRMLFLNAKASRNPDRGVYTDPLEPLYKTLTGIDGHNGTIEQLKDAGFSVGKSHAFTFSHSSAAKLVRPFAYIGSIALIALTISYFVPGLSLAVSLLGFAGGGALFVVAPSLVEKLLSLGGTICASALGLIVAMRYFRRRMDAGAASGSAWKAIGMLLGITAVSSLGMILVVTLQHDPLYMFQIEQFTGVKLLAYMPILLAAVYLVIFSEDLSWPAMAAKVRQILNAKISVLWVICVAVIGAVGMYYLSRTGNEGTASPLEMMFRSFLENTLGVRPRTKEFLIAHPLLVFGAYLAFRRYAAGLYIMLLGAIGQASAVGTFTHLHTPLWISFIRVVLGVGFGAIIGLILIGVWQIVVRGWNQWSGPLKRL